MPIPGFITTFVYLMAGLIVWMARFGAAYGFTGLMCARPYWPQEIFGMSVVTFGVSVMTILALGANGAIGWHAASRLRSAPAQGTENGRFVHATAAAVVALGTVAILWETIPVFMFTACQ